MFLSLTIFLIIISIIGAKLEIAIEGKDGWGKNLPTWRIQNKWTSIIYGKYPFTGYHLYMNLFVLTFLHFPFFFGVNWSISSELKILSLYFLFWILEDLLWFAFNPHFGLKKFKKDEIPWHQDWLLGLPIAYYKMFTLAVVFCLLSIL